METISAAELARNTNEILAKPDSAGLYIDRDESMGAAVRMDVEVDDKPLGQAAARTYFYAELKPGKHTVTSKAENTDTLEPDALPGKLYYVWQEVKMGLLYARTRLHPVDAAQGKNAYSRVVWRRRSSWKLVRQPDVGLWSPTYVAAGKKFTGFCVSEQY